VPIGPGCDVLIDDLLDPSCRLEVLSCGDDPPELTEQARAELQVTRLAGLHSDQFGQVFERLQAEKRMSGQRHPEAVL
jgi:hypothetical protein